MPKATDSPRSLRRRASSGATFGKTLAALGLALFATGGHAAIDTTAAAIAEETAFMLNTFSLLIWGGLVMWMCAGFTMLESGSVRTKNAAVICLKNIGLYSIAGLTFYLIGYNLMYTDVSGWIGSPTLFHHPSADEIALLSGDEAAPAAVIGSNYSVMSDWFFQMVFVATTASIVSDALAGDGDFFVQLPGVLAIGVFVSAASMVAWLALKQTLEVRVSAVVEELGQDAAELGIEAYPEFMPMPDGEDMNLTEAGHKQGNPAPPEPTNP